MTLLAEQTFLWSLQIRTLTPARHGENVSIGTLFPSASSPKNSIVDLESAPTLADAAHLTPPGIDAVTGAAGSEMLSAVFFPILNAGSLNAGACRFASPGSHASHQAAARLGPPGFDPIAQGAV